MTQARTFQTHERNSYVQNYSMLSSEKGWDLNETGDNFSIKKNTHKKHLK